MMLILTLVAFLYMASSVGYFAYMFFQKGRLYYTAYILMGVGFAIHTVHLVARVIMYSSFPVNNLHEIMFLMAWSIVIAFFWIHHRYHLRMLGVYAAPIAALMMIGSCCVPATLMNDPNLFKSFWLWAHVFTIFLGDASIALACGAGTLYIIQENAIKKKNRGFFFSRLPSLELLDATGYACIVTGFSFLTIGLITGAVYADHVWGHFWSWDPKEVWSAITWLFYAVLLHERLTVGWRGRRSAIMAIIGFGVTLFTFLGVNFLLKGHHGPFTAL